MATYALFCGGDTWEQIAGYAHSKIDWLQTILLARRHPLA